MASLRTAQENAQMADGAARVPSFTNPPIIEVVWSVQFSEMAWVLAPHTGLFWQRIRERYPLCEEHAPIAHVVERSTLFSVPAQSVEMTQGFPLSRTWFISDRGNDLIQLQRDRFCCNWRSVRPGDAYPRYAHMRGAFQREWAGFCQFVTDLEQPMPQVDQCELTYINHIPQGQAWSSVKDIGQVFPTMRWGRPTSFLGDPKTLGARLAFDVPAIGGRLHVSLGHGQKMESGPPPREVLILELTARGVPAGPGLEGLLAWFAAARDSIVRGFTDLTGEEMHRLWGREQ